MMPGHNYNYQYEIYEIQIVHLKSFERKESVSCHYIPGARTR